MTIVSSFQTLPAVQPLDWGREPSPSLQRIFVMSLEKIGSGHELDSIMLAFHNQGSLKNAVDAMMRQQTK